MNTDDSNRAGKGVALYVGGDAATVKRRRVAVLGKRMFSAAYGPKSRFLPAEVPRVQGMLDSGAFSDPPEQRLTPEEALTRQLRWEANAARLWGAPWQAEGLVSYDRLIDETWVDGKRMKRRWSVHAGEQAVEETVAAACFLVFQRERLKPRKLVLSCQGVTAEQYLQCARAVLAVSSPRDILGLGGWCIVGRNRSELPEFHRTVSLVVPEAAAHGLKRVHLFGVLYRPALTHLAEVCRSCGIRASTDSAAPVLALTWSDPAKAGARAATVEGNVRWWKKQLKGL